MADNVNVTEGSGKIIATDDVGGVQYQRVKVTWGPDGTGNDTDVATGKPMPVQLRGSDGTDRSNSLPVSVAAGATAIAKAEDDASANADVGVPAMAVRKGTPANTSGTDGDYEMLQMSAGRLWASATIDAALPAGTNAIGTVSTKIDLSPASPTAATVGASSAQAVAANA